MKSLIFTLITLFSVLSLAHGNHSLDELKGFAYLSADSSELKNYMDAIPRAISFVNRGTQDLHQSILRRTNISEAKKREIIDSITYYRENLPPQLRNIKFAVSTNADSEKFCEKGGYTPVFVVDKYTDLVFVCGKMREFMQYRSEKNLDAFAQLLIHEAAHLVDYANECEATEVEFAIITKVGVRTTINRDGYIGECRDELKAYASIPKNIGFERSPYALRGGPSSSGRSRN